MSATAPSFWELLPAGIVFLDQTEQIRYINSSAVELLQTPADKLLGRQLPDLRQFFPELGRVQLSVREQTTQIHGRLLSISRHAAALSDFPAGSILLFKPVAAELAQPDRFLTTISHELRTPLTAVNGYVSMLRSGAAGMLTEQQLLLLVPLERNVERMVQLVNSMLFAASVNGGRQQFEPGYADCRQLIRQIAREQQPQAEAHGQTIETDVDRRLGQIAVDPMHLATILEELLTNSIKYGRAGTPIHLTATLQAHQFAVISVRDEGIGINTDARQQLFEPFCRPEERDEQVRAGGIGIGLSLVRSLVEAYGGRIWFQSVPDEGSTFSFILPIKGAAEGAEK